MELTIDISNAILGWLHGSKASDDIAVWILKLFKKQGWEGNEEGVVAESGSGGLGPIERTAASPSFGGLGPHLY